MPESHESESLEEWSRSNMYLIPSARLPSAKQKPAAAAAEQRYATKWPPARPSRPGYGLSSGSPASPYGRFGKSFPPMLEAPLERREEEESEQQVRNLLRVPSGTERSAYISSKLPGLHNRGEVRKHDR